MSPFRSMVSCPLEFAGHAWCQGPAVEYSLAYIKFKKKVSCVAFVKEGEINKAWKLSIARARLPFQTLRLCLWASQMVQWRRIRLQCRRLGFYPWVEKIPWRRKW